MKKQTFILLLIWLVVLSTNLIAQNTEGFFRLKEGDWFEVQAEQKHISTFGNQIQERFYSSTYLLNYQLQKQLANGNQQYRIRMEHRKTITGVGKDYVGYDSYYPTFEENKTNPELKNQFTLEVTPKGKIIHFTPFKDNKYNIDFTTISSSYGANSSTRMIEIGSDSLMVKLISERLILCDSTQKKIQYIKEIKIPYLIQQPDMKILLTDASFPLHNNTIIQGKMEDQINQEIWIYNLGSYSESYFGAKEFKTDKDGSFTCPIFLKRPSHLRIDLRNKTLTTLTTFLEPGDILNFSEIGYLAHKFTPVNNRTTFQNEDFSEIKKKSDNHYRRAEYNTLLSNAMNKYRYYPLYDKGNQSIITISQETDKTVNQLINSDQGKASDACVDYYRRDWNYFLAAERLRLYEESRRSAGNKLNKDVLTMKDYPADFFLGVDTIPVLMNPFEWNTSYQSFISKAQEFKQSRIGWPIGKVYFQNFQDKYYFSLASLQGYPLYYQIANEIEFEYKHTLITKTKNSIESYYLDFMNNCADPVLTEPLKKFHEAAIQLEIGQTFPVGSFILQDSSIFNLKKYKGKPICLILFGGRNSDMSDYKETIEKFGTEEVNFVFARPPQDYYYAQKLDSTILKKPNVTLIELANKDLRIDFISGLTRIFMLDKWFRIVENNAEDPSLNKYKGSISEFEKSLRKTIETKRYSKAEKTAMIKTAGWSFGSILFTVLIGFWIYKIRIRSIKEKEAAKRRIKELEIKAIRSQMNPHFIFNALNSIQSLINGNQFKEANIYLSKFAILLRGVLNNSEKGTISLSDELQAVELYCQLEQLRFEFKFKINIDDDVKCDLIEIPGMIIQPLAENAVVHGLSAKGELGELSIGVKRQNGHLCVCVSDNGVGLPEITDTLSQKGFGLKLVEERIKILNLDGKEARLTVENKGTTSGTLATLIIPID